MNFAESLATYLGAHAGLTALVGSRIYPVQAPDSPTFPYIVYSLRIEAEDTLTTTAIDRAVVTVDAFARATATKSAYGLAHDIAANVRAALSQFRGTLAVGGTDCEGSSVLSTEDLDSGEFGVIGTTTYAEMYYCP